MLDFVGDTYRFFRFGSRVAASGTSSSWLFLRSLKQESSDSLSSSPLQFLQVGVVLKCRRRQVVDGVIREIPGNNGDDGVDTIRQVVTLQSGHLKISVS